MFCLQAYCGGGLTVVTALLVAASPWRDSIYLHSHWKVGLHNILRMKFMSISKLHTLGSDLHFTSSESLNHKWLLLLCHFWEKARTLQLLQQVHCTDLSVLVEDDSAQLGEAIFQIGHFDTVKFMPWTPPAKEEKHHSHTLLLDAYDSYNVCLYIFRHTPMTHHLFSVYICSKAVKVLPSCCQQHMLCFGRRWTGDFT